MQKSLVLGVLLCQFTCLWCEAENLISSKLLESKSIFCQNIDSSISLAHDAHQLALLLGVDSLVLKTSSQLVLTYVEGNRYHEADSLIDVSLQMAENQETREYQAIFTTYRAKALLRQGEFDICKALCLKNLSTPHGQAVSAQWEYENLLLLFNAYKHKGQLDSAQYYHNRRLQLAAVHENDYWRNRNSLDYGTFLLKRYEWREASNEFRSALKGFTQKCDVLHNRLKNGLAISLYYLHRDSLGQGAFESTLLSKANRLFHTTSKSFLQSGRIKDAAISFNHLANIALNLDKPDSAIFYSHLARRMFLKCGDKNRVASINNNLGWIFESNQSLDSAAFYYRQAYDIAMKIESWPVAQMAANNLSYVFDSLGNCIDALYYQRESQWIHEQKVFKVEKEKAVQKYRVLFETEEKERKMQEALAAQLKTENDLKLFAIIAVALALILVASVILIRSYYIRLRDKKRIHELEMEDLIRKKDEQRQGALLEGQDTERKKIARDLHDELGGTLSMIQMHLSGITEKVEDFKEQEKQQYEKANSLLEKALEQVRNISRDMMSGTLSKFGLMAAFYDLADAVNSSKQLSYILVGTDLRHPVQSAVELGIFRVVQEMTSNTLKYAQATEIRLELIEHEDSLNICYEDNGIGFNLSQAEVGDGLGLKNIRSRVAQMNGDINIETSPGKGVLFMVEIPIYKGDDKGSDS